MAVLKYKDENGNYQEIVGINVQNEVVQTTGNSTTAVMSQKAVSDLVPAQASSSNQLADKEFVNSSITTATATYQGSYNLVSDLSLTISASHGQIETALNTAASGADKNDYSFVQIPTADATPTEIASVERYKHNGTTWSYEYAINNSGFTAAQWAAVNSSITSGLVGKLSGMTNTPYSSTLGLTKLFGMNDNGDCSNIGLSDLASLLGVGKLYSYATSNSVNYLKISMHSMGNSALIYAVQKGDNNLCCQVCNMNGRALISGGGTYSYETFLQDLRLFRLSNTELILKVGQYGGADIFYTGNVTFTNLGSSYDETGLFEFDKKYLILKT